MQVHDELVLEVRAEAVAELTAAVRERMVSAAALNVPLRVDVGIGRQLGRGALGRAIRRCDRSGARRATPQRSVP